MGCRPVFSRLITEGSPLRHYNSTSGRPNVRLFYDQLQTVTDQTPKKDILVVQGDWNAKEGYILVVQGDWNAKVSKDA